jgi:hypothetical protein
MNKYDPLGVFLKSQPLAQVPMTFAEIEKVIGDKLPNSAYRHRPWWSNNPSNSVMTKVWLEAGFLTEQVDMEGGKLVFKRIVEKPGHAPEDGGSGMSEAAREYKPADNLGEKKSRRSPLFGALKGTFWIDPDWDLTKPTLSDEEMAEWDASLDRKAALYEQGVSRKPR